MMFDIDPIKHPELVGGLLMDMFFVKDDGCHRTILGVDGHYKLFLHSDVQELPYEKDKLHPWTITWRRAQVDDVNMMYWNGTMVFTLFNGDIFCYGDKIIYNECEPGKWKYVPVIK